MPDKKVVQWIMTASVVHNLVALSCQNQASEKEKEGDSDFAFYFTAAAYESSLLSIEQSLKLILVFQFSVPLNELTCHDLIPLYEKIKGERGKGLRDRIIKKMNFYAEKREYHSISKKELKDCLETHRNTYKKIRYLYVNTEGETEEFPDITESEARIIDCLRQSLVHLNMEELNDRGIPHPPVPRTIRPVRKG